MTNTTIAVFAAIGVAALLVGVNIIPYTEAKLPITININVGKQGPPGPRSTRPYRINKSNVITLSNLMNESTRPKH